MGSGARPVWCCWPRRWPRPLISCWDGVIPLQNYAAWFLTAGLVAILHPRLERSRCELGTQGRLAGYFLATQAGFFALLRFGWWWQGF